MGLILLTKDQILADYLREDCPLLTGVTDRPSSLKKHDVCVLDADSFAKPYPEQTCLLISRKKQKTQLPLLVRPLAPSALTEALGTEKDFVPHLIKENRALVTANGTLAFPALEFAILSRLFEKKGETVSREELADGITVLEKGASQAEDIDAFLTVYIYRLRKKLSPLGFSLKSHHRQGYSLEDARP